MIKVPGFLAVERLMEFGAVVGEGIYEHFMYTHFTYASQKYKEERLIVIETDGVP